MQPEQIRERTQTALDFSEARPEEGERYWQGELGEARFEVFAQKLNILNIGLVLIAVEGDVDEKDKVIKEFAEAFGTEAIDCNEIEEDGTLYSMALWFL